MRQPVWTPFEVVLLIEAYLKIEKGIITKKEAVSKISRMLREHAISEEKQIDDTFRNENGISMRLEELRYIFTHGENGIKKHQVCSETWLRCISSIQMNFKTL